MSNTKQFVLEQLDNLQNIATELEPKDVDGARWFTCIPMLYAISLGVDTNKMDSNSLGCNGLCSRCLLAIDTDARVEVSNIIRMETILDD